MASFGSRRRPFSTHEPFTRPPARLSTPCRQRNRCRQRHMNLSLHLPESTLEAVRTYQCVMTARSDIVDIVQPGVADLLPAHVDLDLLFESHGSTSSALDVGRLASAENALSDLWSGSRTLAKTRLSMLPVSDIHSLPEDAAANQLALQCSLFCDKPRDRFNSRLVNGQHLDFYVLSISCLKVRQ